MSTERPRTDGLHPAVSLTWRAFRFALSIARAALGIPRGLRESRAERRIAAAYGQPVAAMIVPTACGGFRLRVRFTRCTRSVDVHLGTRWDEYQVPNLAEVAAADTGLRRLGLHRTGPWKPGTERGAMTAPLTWRRRSVQPGAQSRTGLRVVR